MGWKGVTNLLLLQCLDHPCLCALGLPRPRLICGHYKLLHGYDVAAIHVFLDHLLAVVRLVPGHKGNGVNDHNGALNKGLCAHQLIVAGIVNYVQDARGLCHVLAAPREVPALEPHGAVLEVATAAAHKVNALGANLCVGGGLANLKLALLLVRVPAAASGAALVAGVTGDGCVHGGGGAVGGRGEGGGGRC